MRWQSRGSLGEATFTKFTSLKATAYCEGGTIATAVREQQAPLAAYNK
jgi:hypothetical protein